MTAGRIPEGAPLKRLIESVVRRLSDHPAETRVVEVADRSLASGVREAPMADPNDPNQVAAPLPGLVVGVAVVAGDPVRKGQKLLSIEAMKMETTLYAERPGRIAEVLAHVGQQVKTGELLLKMTNG